MTAAAVCVSADAEDAACMGGVGVDIWDREEA